MKAIRRWLPSIALYHGTGTPASPGQVDLVSSAQGAVATATPVQTRILCLKSGQQSSGGQITASTSRLQL